MIIKKYCLISLLSLFALLQAGCTDNITPDQPLVVIIKADDFNDYSPNWQRFIAILQQNDISAAAGVSTKLVVSNHAEILNIRELSALRRSDNQPLIEFWNHGYDHAGDNGDSPEFDNSDVDLQKKHLQIAQRFFSDSLHFTAKTFSAPHNRSTAATLHALSGFPELNVIMRYKMHEKYSLKRPWIDPNKKKCKPGDKICLNITYQYLFDIPSTDVENYFKARKKENYLLIQLHPNPWDDNDFNDFQNMISFLKEKNVKFMTPDEYFQYLNRIN
ncbi:MAG: polysaccharide deacetylase [Bacteroidetes bacterium]|nr:polysaccharide deacetylase [Bacteroidota bacterium]